LKARLISLTDLFVLSTVPRNPLPVVYPKRLKRSADQIFGIQIYLNGYGVAGQDQPRRYQWAKGYLR
jgi:hypothetical protein